MTPTPNTRASLLLKLRDPQDHEAWVDFVSLYEPVIYRILRRTGLQETDSLDVLQELLFAVSRGVDRWVPGSELGTFRGWLRRVARNLVVNWLRRKRLQIVTTSLDLDALLIEERPVETVETREFDNELRRSQFQRAAQQVRTEVQVHTWQAFWGVAVEGHTIGEVAQRLGMSAGAVRVAKCRVLARIRDVIAHSEDFQ